MNTFKEGRGTQAIEILVSVLSPMHSFYRAREREVGLGLGVLKRQVDQEKCSPDHALSNAWI